MKYILIAAFLCPTLLFAQGKNSLKIINSNSASGKQTSYTKLLPIFKMNVVRMGASVETKDNNKSYSIAFYKTSFEVKTDKAVKDSSLCILALADGSKVYGKYLSATSAMGYNILTYSFSKDDMLSISKGEVVSVLCYSPMDAIDLFIDKKYAGNIEKAADRIINL